MEILAFTSGSFSQSFGDGSHLALDGDELFREGVEFFLGVNGVFVTGLKGSDKDFDTNGVKSFFSTLEFVLVQSEGHAGDFLDVLGTTLKLNSQRLDRFNAYIDIPDGLV